MSTQTMTSFPTLMDFYNHDTQRLTSPEADYGVHWRLSPWPNSWRVSYVQKTGEIYAVHSGDPSPGPVLVLGAVPPDPQPRGPFGRETYYQTLDKILEGYPNHCGRKNGLTWVWEKLQDYQARS